MPQDNEQEQLTKLITMVEEALRQDEELRAKYQVGEKFRFIRERLQALLVEIQQGPATKETKGKESVAVVVAEDEVVVYVHLYNAQGSTLRTWQSIITPKALFDYSVNRPIYKEKKSIEDFIKAKANKTQHGYLSVAIKQDRLLNARDDNLKDAMGNPLIKIKEGALRYERLISFTHNEQEYVQSETGDLIKKIE